MKTEYLPIKARMTVSNGAAGNDIFVLNSNICRSSSMNRNIWCCEYLRSIDMETVWKLLNDKINAVRTQELLFEYRIDRLQCNHAILTKTIMTKAATI